MPNPFQTVSVRSRVGFNAAAFFQAEAAGVVIPFLSNFLRQRGWSYSAIGLAVATAGLGVFLMQAPAGGLVDRTRDRRRLFAAVSLITGLCFALVPRLAGFPAAVDALLFISGAAQSFFAPLFGALALALVGPRVLSRAVGENQGWNHAGNIASALVAMGMVSWVAVSSLFYVMGIAAALAAAAVYLILPRDLAAAARINGNGYGTKQTPVRLRDLLRERPVLILLISTALFHLANAPVMPMVALYLKRNGGTDLQIAEVVLVAQLVMIPMAWLTGWACERWGRKPIFGVGFIVLPVRIFLYSLVRDPDVLVVLQALDGIGAGIYGVAIVSMCSDLANGKGHFNALIGIMATALALGGVIGPLAAGWLEDHLGFATAFRLFALVAAIGAIVFEVGMPETMPKARATHLKAVA